MNVQASHVLRWPLWSWRNLTVTAAAALLVLYGIGRVAESANTTAANPTTAQTTTAVASAPAEGVSPALSQLPDPSKTTPTGASTAPVAVSPAPAKSPGTASAAASPAPPAAPKTSTATSAAPAGAESDSVTTLATAFAQAWSSSGRSAQEWTRGIQPFVTSALAAGLAHTDPARVPATKVTGEAELLTASATSAAVRVPTDGGSIVVSVHRTSSGPWQVSDVGPSGQPPGAPTPDLRPRPSPTQG